MRTFLLRICVVLGFLHFPFALSQPQQSAISTESVWFALSNESGRALGIDPIVRAAGKKLIEAPDYCGGSPGNDEFGRTYLQPGQSYNVVFGGARAGQISLKAPKQDESILGALDYTGAVRIGGRISALATNAAVDPARQNTRQAPLPKDVDAALELAKKLFAEAGVPSSLLSKVKQDELTSSTLLPDKTASLIGSYFLPTGGDLDPSDALFFVAKWTQGKLAAEFTLIRIASSPTENETLRFVDQADLFLNGQDEIIVINAYYENYRYRVFGRADDGKGWKQIFETGILGCE